MAASYFLLDEHKDLSLLNFLNLQERGSDTLIIHPGSHSIKFGLAS